MAHEAKGPFAHSDPSTDIHTGPCVYIENYCGLRAKTVLVYLSLELITFAQLSNLIGAGAFSRDIAMVVGGSTKTVWLTQSITILTCSLGIPMSQAADYWGRKWLLVSTTTFGFVGAMIVARSTSMGMAIAGEAICGIGVASQPLLYAISSEILPRRVRPAAQGGLHAVTGCAGIFTLLFGFNLMKRSPNGFCTFWYITSALLLISAATTALLYNPPPRHLQKSLTFKQKIAQLDWTGYALITTGIVLFSIALSWSGNPFSWTDPHILAPFLIGMSLLLWLAIHETVLKKDGMFHHKLFAHRNFALAVFGIFVEGMVFIAAVNYFTFEMSVLYETDPFRVGVRFSITFFSTLVSSIAVSVFSSYTRIIRGPTVLAFLCFVVFNVLMATASTTSSIAVWAYPMFLGIGIGICATLLITAAQLSCPPQLIAVSSGVMTSTRGLGASISLAIYNAIFNSTINRHLGPDIAAAVLPLGLSPQVLPDFTHALTAHDKKKLASIAGVTPQITDAGTQGLRSAYLSAFRYGWVFAAVVSLVAAIAACFFINTKIDLNMHVDAPLDENDEPDTSQSPVDKNKD